LHHDPGLLRLHVRHDGVRVRLLRLHEQHAGLLQLLIPRQSASATIHRLIVKAVVLRHNAQERPFFLAPVHRAF
jgi:hypothetical protein